MTIFEALSKATGVTSPNDDEGTQDFLKRLIKAVNKLDEDEFDKLPEDAQDWFNDAARAMTNEKPIQKLPGFEGDTEPEAEAEDKTPAPRASKKPAKEAVKEMKKTDAKKPAAKDAKTEPEKKTNGTARGTGVLDHLMDAVHENPTWKPADLAAHVEKKHGVTCALANAVGIKQQYRRFGRFFQRKGLFKDDVKLDVG